MKNVYQIVLLAGIFFPAALLIAQPELDIKPDRIEFEDIFNRYNFAFLINKGDEPLTIDSLDYNDQDYIIDFEDGQTLPFTINPDDSVKMNVTLSGFYNITVNDTLDTIYVHNNGIESPEPLRVRIRFFEDDFGTINGNVRDTLNPLQDATVYFYYEGIYLIDTALTDANGFYEKTLPAGNYTIAAEKDGYYVLFYDSTYDPYFAEFVSIHEKGSSTINFTLKAVEDTSYSVRGFIYDSTYNQNIQRGIVIIRHGTHVPIGFNKPGLFLSDTITAFAGIIKPDGSYKINVQYEGYYFVQAYTNYFLPGYYNDEGNASVYWQNADSLSIDTTIFGKNIFLLRDSSYGGGSIGGAINFQSPADETLLEGITLLARNVSNNALYSYNFGKEDGAYRIANLPYGTYEILAQKIGWDNAYSQTVIIDPLNNQVNNINVTFIPSAVEQQADLNADKFILYPNYPNPFNPSTTISFYLPERSLVKVKILNILGETITVLINDEMNQGIHNVIFNAGGLSSGVYLVVLESNKNLSSCKILLLK